MDRPDLPRPINTQDTYLHDIATSLRTLVDRDGYQATPSGIGTDGTVQLQEPKPTMSHVGGGWYEVGGERIRGKDAAEQRLAELGG